LFIDPSLHGLGLGSTLIKRAQNAAQQAFSTLNHLSAGGDTQSVGPVVMFVKCFTANIAGLRAYKRHGFVRKKEYLEEDVKEQMTVLEWDASSASLTQ
jgi:GNAT superfamily N-acetyltransferase